MKRFARIFLVGLLAAMLCMGVCVGCGDGEGTALSGSVTLVMDDKNGTVKEIGASLDGFTDKNSLMDVIDALAEKGDVCYAGTRGIFGRFLTGVGVIEGEGDDRHETYIVNQNTAAGIYLYIYTSVESDKADYQGATFYEYKEKTLAESVVGVSQMKLEDGAVYCITTVTWG